MNSFHAIGRIGKDAVVRHTPAGGVVTGWSVAVDSGFGDRKQTVWLDCAWWGERATKVAEYIKKGDRIGIYGELGTREHDGKTYLTLNVQNVTLLGGGERSGSGKDKPAAPSPEGGKQDDDEIPF